jgi:alanyl-tRNA synthetase
MKDKAGFIESQLRGQVQTLNGVHFLAVKLDESNALIKDLAFSMIRSDNKMFFLAGSQQEGKVTLTLALGKELTDQKGMDAGKLIRDLAHEIKGGGGGQAHFATAGGSNPRGLEKALDKAKQAIESL